MRRWPRFFARPHAKPREDGAIDLAGAAVRHRPLPAESTDVRAGADRAQGIEALGAAGEALRLAAFVTKVGGFAALLDEDASVLTMNDAGRRLLGLGDEGAKRAIDLRDCLAPASKRLFERSIWPDVRADRDWRGELDFIDMSSRTPIPVHLDLSTLRSPRGALVGYAAIASDQTPIKSMQAAHERLRARVRSIMRAAPVGIFFAEAPGARIVSCNARVAEILGRDTDAPPDKIAPAEWAAEHGDGSPVLRGQLPFVRVLEEGVDEATLQARCLRPDGSRVWIDLTSRAVREGDGRLIGAVGVLSDIDEKKSSETLQALLNGELDHRLKNVFAMVQAIVHQTLGSAPELVALRRTLDERLIALSTAHQLLLDGVRDRTTVAAVVAAAIEVHVGPGERRHACEGPEVVLGARCALLLALATHELATNALKYGALSIAAGRVAVSWRIEATEGGPALRFSWAESDGPTVVRPNRTGFGSWVIEKALAAQTGARVSIDFRPDGVVCLVDVPVAKLTS